MEKDADILIFDHARKDAPAGRFAIYALMTLLLNIYSNISILAIHGHTSISLSRKVY